MDADDLSRVSIKIPILTKQKMELKTKIAHHYFQENIGEWGKLNIRINSKGSTGNSRTEK